MGLLDLHLDKVPDQKPVPGGEEYKLTIKTLEQKTSQKDGSPMLSAMFTINDQPDAPPVFQNFMLPKKEDDVGIRNMKLRRIKEFVIAFGFDPAEPLELEDTIGEQGWAILKIDSDSSFGDRNIIGKFIKQA